MPAAALLVAAALVYPVAGTYARKDAFARAPTLDGLGWLRDRAPGDPGAIAWLNDEAAGGEVVLESVGDDYSSFGHARISTFTGLPTVLGWPGHELQWGHRVGYARARTSRACTSRRRPRRRRSCCERYDVRYVVVGPLERTDHGEGGVAKWDSARAARVRPRRDDGLAARTPKLRRRLSPPGTPLVSAATFGRVS